MRIFLGLLLVGLPLLSSADSVEPIDSVESYVNIRSLPEAGSEVVGRLYKGNPLLLVEVVDGWNAVGTSEGVTGFVNAEWSQVIVEELPAEEIAELEETVDPEPVAVEVRTAPDAADEPEDAENEEPTEAAHPEEPVVPEVVEVVAEEEPAEPLTIKGKSGFLVKFKEPTFGSSSQIFDNGNQVGIGTTEPKQRLEVNGSIQIHERNSSVAGLMITQSSGETGYILHNRASTLTIGAGSVDRLTIDRDGNVGIGVARPSRPLELANGAHLSTGGVWTNSSSRDSKENIKDISVEAALAVLAELQPVQYNYKNDAQESYVGFIAEDVPNLVATSDRKGLSAMDIVAVLTKVVQAQQKQIEELEARLETSR